MEQQQQRDGRVFQTPLPRPALRLTATGAVIPPSSSAGSATGTSTTSSGGVVAANNSSSSRDPTAALIYEVFRVDRPTVHLHCTNDAMEGIVRKGLTMLGIVRSQQTSTSKHTHT